MLSATTQFTSYAQNVHHARNMPKPFQSRGTSHSELLLGHFILQSVRRKRYTREFRCQGPFAVPPELRRLDVKVVVQLPRSPSSQCRYTAFTACALPGNFEPKAKRARLQATQHSATTLVRRLFYATADEADAYMFYRCFFCFFPAFSDRQKI